MATLLKTVIVVDDDPATLESLDQILTKAGFRVVSYQSKETLQKASGLIGTRCVLILGDGAGVGFLTSLRELHFEIPVIFLHSGNSIAEAVRAIQAGAADYLSKPFSPKSLVASVNRAMLQVEEPAKPSGKIHKLQQRAATLTLREREIISLILSGKLNKEIAQRLNLALVTVKVHRGKAMRKLGARTAGELARIVRDLDLMPVNGSPRPLAKTTRARIKPD